MRVLRILLLFVEARLGGQRGLAVGRADVLAHGAERFLGDAHRVGAHVGDEPDGAVVADAAALVEPLRERHRLADREAERARRGLLQLGCREGRRRVLAPLARLDRRHAQRRSLDVPGHLLGRLARGEPRVAAVEVELVAPPRHDARGEGRFALRERHRHREVGDRDEGLALGLALDDDPQRHGLHAPGRQPAPDLVPEQLRDLVADQAVDDAARLLGAHAVLRDLAGVLDRLRDRGLRDLVELGAVEGGVRRLLLQQLVQVPADRLALAVRVGGEVHTLGFLGEARQLSDGLLLARHHAVVRLVVLGAVDREPLAVEIAHVSVGGGDLEILSEELPEGARLGRRLDDDQRTRHVNRHDGTPVKPPAVIQMPGSPQGAPRISLISR